MMFVNQTPLDLVPLFVLIGLIVHLIDLKRMKKILDRLLAQENLRATKPPNTPLPVGYQKNGQGWSPMQLCLRQLREKKGMSQAELAEKSGISQEFIHEIEEGLMIPEIFVAKRLAKTLGVSIDELIVEEN